MKRYIRNLNGKTTIITNEPISCCICKQEINVAFQFEFYNKNKKSERKFYCYKHKDEGLIFSKIYEASSVLTVYKVRELEKSDIPILFENPPDLVQGKDRDVFSAAVNVAGEKVRDKTFASGREEYSLDGNINFIGLPESEVDKIKDSANFKDIFLGKPLIPKHLEDKRS